MIFYVAAPFFNVPQNETLTHIEALLTSLNFAYISPRKSGLILKDMTPEHRKVVAPAVYRKNVNDLKIADGVVAVIDDFDPGTIWEMGFAAALEKHHIYTYTGRGYGVNVMLAGCVRGHAKGMPQLREMLNAVKNGTTTDHFTVDAAT
jgi:nucleoside deoxyribosyltransferase